MSTSHLINANIHRAKEGARVLEDIARFLLRDEILLRQIREIRHQIKISAPIYDIKTDLGGLDLIENNLRGDLLNVIQANAIRLQEALRVLEEMTEVSIDKQSLKALRYQAYDIHAKLYYAAKKYLKWDLLRGLYLIIDPDIILQPIEEVIDIINQSLVNIVQYRNKSADKKNIVKNALKIKQRLNSNKLLIINDHIDIALDIGDGVHLGQDDYPLERISHVIPDHFILGISCHHLAEAIQAQQFNATYIAIGCLFNTQSKPNVIAVSLETLQKICKEISLPVCAIGGINMNNFEQVLSADIKMAAIISSAWKTEQPLLTINHIHDRIIEAIKINVKRPILG